MRCDEDEQADEHQHRGGRVVAALEGEHDDGEEAEADQVADRADEHQRAAPDAVDDRQCGHGGDQVHEAHCHAHQVGRVVGGARLLHDNRSVVEDRVHAGQLVEHGDREGHQDHLAVALGEERHLGRARRGVLLELSADLGDLEVGFLNRLAELAADLHGLGFASVGHQPARSLGNGEQQQDEDRRGCGHHAEHPAPSGLFGDDLADDEVAQVGEQDAEHDIELDEADQAATLGRRGDLSGVDRRAHARHADADTAEEPEEHEDVVTEGAFGCQGGPQRTDEVEGTDDEQHLAAAVLVGELPGENSTDDGADGSDRDGETETARGEAVHAFEGGGGARDNGGVEAEDQTADGGDDGTADDQRIGARVLLGDGSIRHFGVIPCLRCGVSYDDICYNVVATRVTTL